MILEIVLIVLGIAAVVAGYLIPAKKENENTGETISKEMIQEMVGEEMESAKGQISDMVDETINYAMEKTERSMDRLSNEKMMAVSEYSDTVLEQINKNHEEVVFLYDMLNDKHENLKSTVAEAEKAATNVKETIKQAEDFTPILVEKTAQEESKAKKASKPKKEKTIKPVPVIKAVNNSNSEKPSTENKAGAEQALETSQPAEKENTQVFDELLKADSPDDEIKTAGSLRFSDQDDEDEGLEEEWDDFDTDDEDGPFLSFNSRTPGNRNSNDRILELHKAGKSNMAIAKELGLGVGEVKLVIDLFKGAN